MAAVDSKLAKFETIKSDIRALLVSRNSKDITLPVLNKLYKDITDEDIPYSDFNYTNLKQFLNSMPDILNLKNNKNNELCIYHIDSEKSRHISSLVSREKKKTNSQERKILLRRNAINPNTLYEVLQELKNSTPNQRVKIKKSDVLSSIERKLGRYNFYSMKNLNDQLYEFCHLLNHDENYIYFKDKLSENKTRRKNTEHKEILFKYEDPYIKTNSTDMQMSTPTQYNSVGELIKDSTKIKLQKLIEKYPKGILCSQLPRIYQQEYRLNLEYIDLGFNSIIEFVSALSDILKLVKPFESNQYLIVNPNSNLDDCNILDAMISKTSEREALGDNHEVPAPLPMKLSPNVIKSLMPKDVIGLNETVDQFNIISFVEKYNKVIDVTICEVHNPSYFWIIPRQNEKIIKRLMNDLQDFYASQNLDKYRIPPILISPGLHIACMFENQWHRGIIKKVTKQKEAIVHFYDYGTNVKYNPKDLFHLSKRFSTIPGQAISCTLSHIQPIETNDWPISVNHKFTTNVFEKHFSAVIQDIDEEKNHLIVCLKSLNNNQKPIFINHWLIMENIAKCGIPIISKNIFTLKYYNRCIKNDCLSQSNNTIQTIQNGTCKTSTADHKAPESIPTNFVSANQKLEALQKYKLKTSKKLIQSPNTSISDECSDEKSYQDIVRCIKIKIEDKDSNENESNNSESINNSDEMNYLSSSSNYSSSSISDFNNKNLNDPKSASNLNVALTELKRLIISTKK